MRFNLKKAILSAMMVLPLLLAGGGRTQAFEVVGPARKVIDSSDVFGSNYGYAPAIVREGSRLHMFYCSKSMLLGMWDAIRYSYSDDGINWSFPTVVLDGADQTWDRSACDPSVVRFTEGGKQYYYLYFSSYSPEGFQTFVGVARSERIEGPYRRYVDPDDGADCWEGTPGCTGTAAKALVIARNMVFEEQGVEGGLNFYGAGQQTVVVSNGQLHMWYNDDTFWFPKKLPNVLYRVATTPTSWSEAKTVDLPGSDGIDSIDVKYDRAASRFVMIYTYGHHANGAKMKFAADVALYRRYSVGADPRKWTSEEVVCDATCLPDHAHNPGLSGDASGQVSAGTELVIFGAPYDLSRSYRLLPDQAAPLPADESTVVTAGCYSGKELPGVYPAGYAPYCWGYWDLYSVQIGDALPFRDISTTPADGIARLDWDYGRGKAMCRAGERIVGLSANVRDGQAERALCRNGGDPYTGIRTVPLTVDARADQRHAARIPDWDFGYYKLECGQSEYVAGVSQNASFVQGSNRFHAILCAAGKRLPAGTGGCRTRLLLARDDRATTATGDWHFGAYKAECGSAEYLAGVSVSPSTGAPHALLCCGKPTPGAQDRPQLPPKPPLSLLPPRG